MEDARWMRVALGLARRQLGLTWPNPAVGAVIVRGAQLLGRGATAPGGRPHAETIAIEQARARFGEDALRGATAYVSLEPCAHHGRTPPCAEALIAAGITRVVCPITDPDPRVGGRGIEMLKSAQIEVRLGVLEAEARRINAGFLSCVERGRPSVTLKLATTLDGRIATRTGESRWITGKEARRRVHLMRADHDAVLIGAGTARADDPSLDVRDLGLEDRRPVRIVADGSLSLSPESRLARTAREQPLWLLHRPHADAARGARLSAMGVELLPTATSPEGPLAMAEAMQVLAERGLTRVFCEGGGQLAASLLAGRLVDRIALFTAGRAIGGDGVPAIGGFGIESLSAAPRFTLDHLEQIGADVLSWWVAG
ncbi:MAG TPA: bifunctional diaminohydroxyphosphoribosylaminopyrimidine deaminase/5-amino-6-(5-phosphoribosylamino)uracil reductase RibD [Paracoccaceae bacterium]|nr:bifunctional diaminohydroxyphosphoribosylaminopyrimidine deaminase/5-amino-6-(5-phosphoribosylamino)uracil reductase RibD [Paracoccaceae bacterium]